MRALSLVCLCVLGGCSASALTLAEGTAPYPHDYRDIALRLLGPDAELSGLQMSRPRPMASWSVLAPATWYVCVRRPAPQATPPYHELVILIDDGVAVDTMEGPLPLFCDGGTFEPLA